MSLSRTTLLELCSYVQEKCATVLGNKFWNCRCVIPADCGYKPDKLESRIFALSKFRFFILSGKSPQSLKIERSFHILYIRSVQVNGEKEVIVHSEVPSKELAMHLLKALKHYFPDLNKSLKSMMEITPCDYYERFESLPVSVPLLPCRSFRRSYAALCDYFDQPFREEVVWDIEKIYANHHLRVLRLEDFTHLLSRDLVPIVAVCQSSDYFTGVSVDGTKLTPDLVEVIVNVIKRSRVLKTLILRNCSLPRYTFSFLALNALLSKLSHLRSVTLSECGITEKTVNVIAAGLMQGIKPNDGLKEVQISCLDLSGNTIRDDVNDFLQFLSLCESLRSLNLSDTGFNIDKLWGTLRFGGLQLETLKLAGCQCNRRNKEGMQNMKEYFASAVGLKYIDFSNTVLGAEMLKHLLTGLATNQQLKPFRLVLDAMNEKGFLQTLEAGLSDIDASGISLRDDGLEANALGILNSCSLMPHLVHLDLSGANFTSLKRSTKHQGTLTSIVLALVKLFGDENSRLNDLILSDCRLGTHLSVLLNTLGVSSSLQYLDISGNEMGNFGARLLAKALQVNLSLRTLVVDRNQVTGDGYADIALSFCRNTTLTAFPYPINDASESLSRADRGRTLSALAEVFFQPTFSNKTGSSVKNTLKLFGHVDSPWKVMELSSKFADIVDSLPTIGDSTEPLDSQVEQVLNELEGKAITDAKVNLS
ncbi:unnamed protein product [Enterobius vermicularis]|uniref:Carm_PH domain-containing protein n=1 Tax=Enterobius vermicularis TaxID=51028 RepID=A0A0N4VDZ3_ENTVE|nr:unnamed protein product [Enterobius vermicularis]